VKILVSIVTGLITFGIISKVISTFLETRVKHLFQIIHKPEDQNADELKLNQNQPLLEQVELEVSKYLKSQNHELNTLRDLEKYRQDFVGNVAHELKTPIFNIQGYVHTLKDGAIDDPEVNKLYLQRASDNIDRMIKIIEDLDSVYKLESNQLKLEWQDIEIQSFVETMKEEIKLQALEKNISVLIESDLPNELKVKADADYLRQVFINLLENSVKYGKENGETYIKLLDLDQNVLIEIQDDGPGIESRHLRHIFDRFYRVDKARSRQAGGSGLGLSIVKHILEAHGQSIKVRSTPGVGTIFSFTLAKSQS
jgi:two-component system phosphate regulon sensor histidine kinase PhoR